ncbi:MAG: DUF4279 domain-containing protein [Syntrophobacteraceae bacterium]
MPLKDIVYDRYKENPACKRVQVAFRVAGDSLVPSEITKLLKVEPTRIVTQPWGVWSISSDAFIDSKSTAKHVRYILDKIEPMKQSIATLIEDEEYDVSFSIWWEADDRTGGYRLSRDELIRLSALCNYIDFFFIG